ncbi:MAG: hypothetical protein GY765_02050 [bacterium]|nr:hypothetical protein [bacterium]
MTECIACEKKITEDTRTCPNCGAKQLKRNYPTAIIIALIIFGVSSTVISFVIKPEIDSSLDFALTVIVGIVSLTIGILLARQRK